MRNNYNQYIKPVLQDLSPDAYRELSNNAVAKEVLDKMCKPTFWFCRKNQQDVMTNVLFWEIICLYARAEFFNPAKYNNFDDTQKFKAVIETAQEDSVRKSFNFVSHVPCYPMKNRFKNLQNLVKYARLEKMY